MVYAFYITENNGNANLGSTLESICGSRVGANTGASNCGVAVDTNGYSKGVKTSFGANSGDENAQDGQIDIPFNATSGFTNVAELGTDRLAFVLSASGIKPAAVEGGSNKAWYYIYGNNPEADDYQQTHCCRGHFDCYNQANQYTCQSYYVMAGTSTCPSGYKQNPKGTYASACTPDAEPPQDPQN